MVLRALKAGPGKTVDNENRNLKNYLTDSNSNRKAPWVMFVVRNTLFKFLVETTLPIFCDVHISS